ncbi:MAG: DUF167 domain-containing protein [Candidatus Aenigmarchaeota archaeon]|nr:DUF167 domain-containing protein [Candidatus Aenigmarchaeota archaeon]
MRINVSVNPNSKYSQVEKLSDYDYKVRVDAQAKDGEANERLIEILAEHFEVSKASVSIVKGFKSKRKIVDVRV